MKPFCRHDVMPEKAIGLQDKATQITQIVCAPCEPGPRKGPQRLSMSYRIFQAASFSRHASKMSRCLSTGKAPRASSLVNQRTSAISSACMTI